MRLFLETSPSGSSAASAAAAASSHLTPLLPPKP
jgi:hypothetical protein